MPSKKNIEQYENLSEKFSRAKAVYFTEYHGLKVSEITRLRNMFFKSDVEYLVAKNTLLRKVADERKIDGLGDVLKGSTAIAISYNEPVSPAKVIKDFVKENDLPNVKGILFNGVILPGEDFKRLADMPSKDEMLAQLALMLKNPMQKFVSTISSPMQKALGVLNNLKEKKS
ncbi:50S ribosomal protein L10 [Candidatus Marinimicrobia bacterium]|nr:50S ribosomal protein L10 [Candidatus Neomarinimicrobiota bacterium]